MNLFEEDERPRPRWPGQPERTYQPPEVLRCATAADAAFAEPERACESTRTATGASPDAGIAALAIGALMPIGNQAAKRNEPPATTTAAAVPQPTPKLPVATGTESPSKGFKQDRQGRFRCDHCGGGLKVISSRPQDGYRLRRYQCLGCTERLTTVEVVVPGGINPHCSLDSAVARVMQNFVRRAPLAVLLKEIKRRQETPHD